MKFSTWTRLMNPALHVPDGLEDAGSAAKVGTPSLTTDPSAGGSSGASGSEGFLLFPLGEAWTRAPSSSSSWDDTGAMTRFSPPGDILLCPRLDSASVLHPLRHAPVFLVPRPLEL